MAVITQTSATDGNQPATLTRIALSASDTLTYVQGSKQTMFLYNTTAALVTVTFTGSAATSISPPGYGGSISVAGGKAIAVPANGSVLLELDDIYAYLQGTVTVTGGTGVTAHLYT